MTSIEIDYTAINTVCAEKRHPYYGIYYICLYEHIKELIR